MDDGGLSRINALEKYVEDDVAHHTSAVNTVREKQEEHTAMVSALIVAAPVPPLTGDHAPLHTEAPLGGYLHGSVEPISGPQLAIADLTRKI